MAKEFDVEPPYCFYAEMGFRVNFFFFLFLIRIRKVGVNNNQQEAILMQKITVPTEFKFPNLVAGGKFSNYLLLK